MSTTINIPNTKAGLPTQYIPTTITGSTEYTSNWLSSASNKYPEFPSGQVITPTSDYLYIITDPNYSGTKIYYWDGTQYSPLISGGGVAKTDLTPPTFDNTVLYYDAINPISLASYLDNNYDPSLMILSGVTSTDDGNGGIRDVGTYTATVTLKDPQYYQWTYEDQGGMIHHDTDPKTISWVVNKKVIQLPVISGSSTFTYDGSVQGPNFVKGSDSSYYNLVNGYGETQTNAGSYTTKYKLNNYTNTQWAAAQSGIENDSQGNPTIYGIGWGIDKAKIGVPAISSGGTLSYNGSTQGPTFSNYTSGDSRLSVANLTATNAGSYTATFDIVTAAQSNYEWSTGGVGTVSLGWSIEKVAPSLSVSPTSWASDSAGATQVVTITTNSDGVLTASSGDTTLVSVGSVSGGTFTMTSVAKGNTTITINLAAGTNWTSSSTTISYAGNWIDIDNLPTTPTYNDLITIADAYYNGSLDSTAVSKVKTKYPIGTTFTVSSLSAQTGTWDDEWRSLTGDSTYYGVNSPSMPAQTNVVFEIIDYEHDNLTDVTGTGGKTKALFTIQQKNMINGCNMYWNHTTGDNDQYEKQYGSNKGGWQESAIRKWLNNGIVNSSTITSEVSPKTGHTVWLPKSTATVANRVGYYQSLPSDLKAGIKPVEKITIKVRSNTSITASTDYTKDYIWLPSETEIYGSKSSSPAAVEGTHYSTKYSSNSNRIKQKGGTNYYWWERSVYSSYSCRACYVHSSGGADSSYCGYSGAYSGVAPAFCI